MNQTTSQSTYRFSQSRQQYKAYASYIVNKVHAKRWFVTLSVLLAAVIAQYGWGMTQDASPGLVAIEGLTIALLIVFVWLVIRFVAIRRRAANEQAKAPQGDGQMRMSANALHVHFENYPFEMAWQDIESIEETADLTIFIVRSRAAVFQAFHCPPPPAEFMREARALWQAARQP